LLKKAVSEKLVSFLKFLMMLMSTNDEESEKCIAPITKRGIFFTWKIFWESLTFDFLRVVGSQLLFYIILKMIFSVKLIMFEL